MADVIVPIEVAANDGLPRICIVCGAPATGTERVKVGAHTRSLDVGIPVPVCAGHWGYDSRVRRRYLAYTWGVFLLIVVGSFGSALLFEKVKVTKVDLVGPFLLLGVVGIFVQALKILPMANAWMARQPGRCYVAGGYIGIRGVTAHANAIELRNAADGFVHACNGQGVALPPR